MMAMCMLELSAVTRPCFPNPIYQQRGTKELNYEYAEQFRSTLCMLSTRVGPASSLP